ncbi:MAG: HlyD family efflux transporter periplasmic adaptor subunit, partial [Deltaproteobacteria bacterium]|nr:HlyD family efflux transporter periplasmic adaptor subunit [Deltaproteobacteria bacterium]
MIIRIKSVLFMAAFLCFFATFPIPCQAMEVEAISMPSADIMLSFVMTGQISKVRVKEGDSVKRRELLSVLDNRTERIKVEELKAKAEDESSIEAAAAELDQKRVDLKKLESAHAKGAVTKWELEHSKLNVRIAELSLQAVTLEREQNQRRLRQALSQLDRMRLTSPVSGRVEKVLVKPGESARALDPIIQVVQINPLWIDIPVPMAQVSQLEKGQMTPVIFPGAETGETA